MLPQLLHMSLLTMYLVPYEEKKSFIDGLISLERTVSQVELLVGQLLSSSRPDQAGRERAGSINGDDCHTWAGFLDLHSVVITVLAR